MCSLSVCSVTLKLLSLIDKNALSQSVMLLAMLQLVRFFIKSFFKELFEVWLINIFTSL
jgi:hypothetical protein